MKLNNEHVIPIVEGIIKCARADYINAKVHRDRDEIFILRKFFRSNWFALLSLGVSDSETIIRALDKQGEYEKLRREHKCSPCKRNCVHRMNGDWTSMERGRFICLKEEEEKKNGKKNRISR